MDGFFQETVTLINRAPFAIRCCFDGKEAWLQPGENAGFPLIAVPYAKNQNPIMGSEDIYNPSLSGFRYLVGVKGKDDCTPMTAEEIAHHRASPQRLNRDQIIDERGDKKSREVVRGRVLPNAFEARFATGDDGGVLSSDANAAAV